MPTHETLFLTNRGLGGCNGVNLSDATGAHVSGFPTATEAIAYCQAMGYRLADNRPNASIRWLA